MTPLRVALVTPMKPPGHAVPSGDRTFARLIASALAAGGHAVTLPSTLSTRCDEPAGFAAAVAAAGADVARIAAIWRAEGPPDAVLTYHSYHRAPDLVGAALAKAFALPYAIVEASRAEKHCTGPWAEGFALADAALDRADAVGAVTGRDLPALAARIGDRAAPLPPFVDAAPFRASPASELGAGAAATVRGAGPAAPVPGAIVSAAMMRPGRKADSVALLAEVFSRVRARVPATIRIAGDGEARQTLEPLFPPETFAGLLDPEALGKMLRAADVFVWPALQEPIGLVFLEAQAAGLPVVGGDAAGVRAVVADGGILTPEGDAAAMADAVVRLLTDRPLRDRTAAAARAFAAANDLAAGARRLDDLLARAVRRRCAR